MFRKTRPPELSRAHAPLGDTLRAVEVVAATDSAAPQMQWELSAEGTDVMTLPTALTLQGAKSAQIAHDPVLRACQLGAGVPESIVAGFWHRLFTRLLDSDNLAYLVAPCNVLDVNMTAGSHGTRASGVYGPLRSSAEFSSSGIVGQDEVVANGGASANLSGTLAGRNGVDHTLVPDMALLAPLSIFSRDVQGPFPISPILVVEIKSTSSGNLSGSSVGLGQLASAARRSSVHRECIYGLLCIDDYFTRVYFQANDYVEIDMRRELAREICALSSPSPTPEAPFTTTWTAFRQHALNASQVYPRVHMAGSVRERPSIEMGIESIRDLVTLAITQAHESIVHRIDTQPAPIEAMTGCVRLRIVGIYEPAKAPSCPVTAAASLRKDVHPAGGVRALAAVTMADNGALPKRVAEPNAAPPPETSDPSGHMKRKEAPVTFAPPVQRAAAPDVDLPSRLRPHPDRQHAPTERPQPLPPRVASQAEGLTSKWKAAPQPPLGHTQLSKRHMIDHNGPVKSGASQDPVALAYRTAAAAKGLSFPTVDTSHPGPAGPVIPTGLARGKIRGPTRGRGRGGLAKGPLAPENTREEDWQPGEYCSARPNGPPIVKAVLPPAQLRGNMRGRGARHIMGDRVVDKDGERSDRFGLMRWKVQPARDGAPSGTDGIAGAAGRHPANPALQDGRGGPAKLDGILAEASGGKAVIDRVANARTGSESREVVLRHEEGGTSVWDRSQPLESPTATWAPSANAGMGFISGTGRGGGSQSSASGYADRDASNYPSGPSSERVNMDPAIVTRLESTIGQKEPYRPPGNPLFPRRDAAPSHARSPTPAAAARAIGSSGKDSNTGTRAVVQHTRFRTETPGAHSDASRPSAGWPMAKRQKIFEGQGGHPSGAQFTQDPCDAGINDLREPDASTTTAELGDAADVDMDDCSERYSPSAPASSLARAETPPRTHPPPALEPASNRKARGAQDAEQSAISQAAKQAQIRDADSKSIPDAARRAISEVEDQEVVNALSARQEWAQREMPEVKDEASIESDFDELAEEDVKGKDESMMITLDHEDEAYEAGHESSEQQSGSAIVYMPPNCRKSARDCKANRDRLVKEQKILLNNQCRDVERTIWRDDGLAVDWVLNKSRGTLRLEYPQGINTLQEKREWGQAEAARFCALDAGRKPNSIIAAPTRAIIQWTRPRPALQDSFAPLSDSRDNGGASSLTPAISQTDSTLAGTKLIPTVTSSLAERSVGGRQLGHLDAAVELPQTAAAGRASSEGSSGTATVRIPYREVTRLESAPEIRGIKRSLEGSSPDGFGTTEKRRPCDATARTGLMRHLNGSSLRSIEEGDTSSTDEESSDGSDTDGSTGRMSESSSDERMERAVALDRSTPSFDLSRKKEVKVDKEPLERLRFVDVAPSNETPVVFNSKGGITAFTPGLARPATRAEMDLPTGFLAVDGACITDELFAITQSHEHLADLPLIIYRYYHRTLEERLASPQRITLAAAPHVGTVSAICAISYAEKTACFATGGHDRAVNIWNIATDFTTSTLSMVVPPQKLVGNHSGRITSLVYSQEPKWLVSAGDDCRVKVFDCASQTFRAPLEFRVDVPLTSLHVNAKSPHLLATERKHTRDQFCVYDMRDRPRTISTFGYDQTKTTSKLNAPSRFVKGSFSGLHFAKGDRDGSVRVWDLRRTDAPIRTVPLYQDTLCHTLLRGNKLYCLSQKSLSEHVFSYV